MKAKGYALLSKSAGYNKTRCPECLAPIWLSEDVLLWYPITCPECHTALEVVDLQPLQLGYMTPFNEEDDDDEEA